MSEKALAGVRVLDFTRVLAGPMCTMMLADLGAEVIKVERQKLGDDTRHWGPPWAGEMSAYFASVNRNKKSITLDLRTNAAVEIAKSLARESHIVVENFKVGQMAQYGLGYKDLKAENPAIVYCSITGFGQTGPYAERAGYDYVVQAMSGLMSITGAHEGMPHKVGVAISDVIAGLFAHGAILAALRHAERTEQGQYIDISLLDTQIAALVNIASNVLVSGKDAGRFGNQHANIVPYQTFEAQDKAFVVAVGNDKQFRLLAHLIQRPDLAHDERFASNPARVKNREVLVDILAEVFKAKPAREWVDLLTDAGIPCGEINTVQEALGMEHVVARDLVHEVMLSDERLLNLVGSPLKLSETPLQIRSAPPALGADTDVVLGEILGMSEETIAGLRSDGVV
ncbi:MAG: CaiB/BaiF CoA-transferase family protein [Chloroflexota bacterium]